MNSDKETWPIRLLRSFCPPQLLEEIEGDLLQRYERDLKSPGHLKWPGDSTQFRAKRRLFWSVLRFFRFEILLRNKMQLSFGAIQLFSNYFKITYRHAAKNKLSFGFRLGGLLVALFSFLIIALYVTYQLSFDKFHQDYKNIYRVNSSWEENNKEVRCASVPSATGAALKAAFPEIKSYSIVSGWGPEVVRYKDKLFRSNSILEAESSVFDVFTFKFISGGKRALVRPGGMVITRAFARQLFNNDDPVGKLISFPDENNRILEVRAVIEDLPSNSSLDVNAIVNYGALRDAGDGELYSWNIEYGGNLFVRLNHQVNVEAFQKKIKSLADKNLPKSFDGRESKFRVFLQPLSDIYMGEPLRWEFDRKGNPVYLYIYFSVAIFILAIAGINYLNLSIADFGFRNKEIGVRKVLGARKKQIIFQITLETILHCFLALIASTAILYISFPQVSQCFGITLEFYSLFRGEVLTWTSAAILILIILSAAYPAYCLSANNPIHDLKRKQLVGGNLSANKILLLAQFAISVFCVSATWVVGNQLDYIQTKDIGFDRNNLLEVSMPYRYPLEKAPVLKEEINKLAGVQSTSFAYYHITGIPYFNAWYKVESGNEMKPVMLNEIFADEDFIRTMGLTLVEGRNFKSKNEFRSAFIINQTAAREFGWTDALGKKIAVGHDKEKGGIWSEGTVIGVIKDFNTRSLHKRIEPIVLRLQYDDWPGNHLNVKYSGSEKDIVAAIKKTYEKVLPGFLINYNRVNEQYENQYIAEGKAFSTLQMATWIILLISCIGIFSMSLFISFKRQKEFGIRKVVGASVIQITKLHVNYFLKVGLVANTIALPLSYVAMKEWLNGFAYQAEVSSLQFMVLGVLLLLFVALSAGYSAWKSGTMNPVDVIKME